MNNLVTPLEQIYSDNIVHFISRPPDMMDYVLSMMDYVLTMMEFVLTMMGYVLPMMDCVL